MAICGGGDASLSTMGFGGFICHNTRCVYMYAVFFTEWRRETWPKNKSSVGGKGGGIEKREKSLLLPSFSSFVVRPPFVCKRRSPPSSVSSTN